MQTFSYKTKEKAFVVADQYSARNVKDKSCRLNTGNRLKLRCT